MHRYRIILELIAITILLWYLLTPQTLLTIGIVGVSVLLRYNDQLRRTVRCYISFGVLLTAAFSISLLLLPIVLLRPWNIQNVLIGAFVVKPLSSMLGIRWEIRNAHNMIPDNKCAVIVANHQTALDVLGMMYLVHSLNFKCTVVARKLIFWFWPFGLTLWLCGVVFISRKPNFQKTHRQMNQAARIIEEQRAKIWIYPEGTRNKNPNTLLPFKKGAFRLAIQNQIPIVPIVFSSYDFVDWHERRFESGTVVIDILPPIPTEGLTYGNIDSLTRIAYNIMSAKNTELRMVKPATDHNNVRTRKKSIIMKSAY